MGCDGLENITVPASVSSIGWNAFADCIGLTSIIVEQENAIYHSSGNCLIETATKTLVAGCKSSDIPNDGSVTVINDAAFMKCKELVNITIPDGITSIGNYAFSGCDELENITIPSSVTSIGNNAFSGCGKLENIMIPASITFIGENAFSACIGLTSIIVEKGNTIYHSSGNCLIETATKTLVLGCKSSIIPSNGSVTIIGDNAFFGCCGLTDVIIPDGVITIGRGAFQSCDNLTSITISRSVVFIDENVFGRCFALTTLNYLGTIEEWMNIVIYRFYEWHDNTRLECITCIDGNSFV